MRGDLNGSTAVVSGAGRGLGRATCLHLAGLGAAVVALDIDAETAKETAALVESVGPPAMAIEMDVTDENLVGSGMDRIDREMGGFDILVNNAGVDVTLPITELSSQQWRSVLDVNLTGPFLLSQQAFQRMAGRSQQGRIVNIVSTASKGAWANASAYHASKWGLLGLSHALHVEGRAVDIAVTAIIAGGMRTPFLTDRFPEVDLETLQDPAHVAAAIGFAVTSPPGTVIPEMMVLPTQETSWP